MATRQLNTEASRSPLMGLSGVPVLLYHGLARSEELRIPAREQRFWVSGEGFRAHLQQIRQAGRVSQSLAEAWYRSRTGAQPGVALTFDDGLATDYEVAFPALIEAGARADFFVNTSRLGGAGYLDWQQMAEMQKAGMAFNSHSHEHVVLTRLSPRALASQLGTSRKMLEDGLGHSPEFLAVPYGFVNRRVVETALELGFRAVCTSRPWPATPGRRTIARVVVHGHTTPNEFFGLISGDAFTYARLSARAASLYLPKQILLRFDPRALGVRVLETQA